MDPYDVNFVPPTETLAFPANGNYATGVFGKMLHFRSSFQVQRTAWALRTLDVQAIRQLAKMRWRKSSIDPGRRLHVVMA